MVATTLFRKNGKLVRTPSGKLKRGKKCCCAQPCVDCFPTVGGPWTVDGEVVAGIEAFTNCPLPQRVIVTFNNLQNGTDTSPCTDCGSLNGVPFILTYDGGCIWKESLTVYGEGETDPHSTTAPCSMNEITLTARVYQPVAGGPLHTLLLSTIERIASPFSIAAFGGPTLATTINADLGQAPVAFSNVYRTVGRNMSSLLSHRCNLTAGPATVTISAAP